MSEFTLQDWRNTVKETYDIPEEVTEQLESIAAQFAELAEKHGVTYCLNFCTRGDSDTTKMSNSANFMPLSRAPLELLLSYRLCMEGVNETAGLIIDLANEGY